MENTNTCTRLESYLHSINKLIKECYLDMANIRSFGRYLVGTQVKASYLERELGSMTYIKEQWALYYEYEEPFRLSMARGCLMTSTRSFFEYYEDDFRRFYQPDWEFLTDYNRDLMTLVCELLDITPQINNTEKFQAVPLMDFQGVAPRPYYQVFSARHGFIPDLSIVDLLFNMGPESVLYL